MTATLCAFCEKHSHMTAVWAEVVVSGGASLLQTAARCDNCGRASLAATRNFANVRTDPRDKYRDTPDAAFQWFPRTGVAPDFPDVPGHIARAAKEAHASESINSYMSAILMARTVVEATAKDKGIKTGHLVAKIDELASKGFIRLSTKDAAHEIRHFGNDMAHGDIEDVPDAEDVQDVLVLMDEILAEVFQGPARTARLMQKRTAPKTP